MCTESTIPLSVFALDLAPPLDGWGALCEREGVEITEDDVGRPAIAREDAARLVRVRRATEAYIAERRAAAEAEGIAAAADIPRGAPALADASALASMMAASPPDRPKSVYEELLDEAFAQGRV